MLKKIPSIPHVDKMRIIQLIEADLNGYLKVVIGRNLMMKAENENQLDKEVYGVGVGELLMML